MIRKMLIIMITIMILQYEDDDGNDDRIENVDKADDSGHRNV